MKRPTRSFPPANLQTDIINSDLLFFEKKSRQKKLQLSGSLCRLHIFNKGAVFPLLFDLRCVFPKRKAGKRNFSYRGVCADFIFSIKRRFFRSFLIYAVFFRKEKQAKETSVIGLCRLHIFNKGVVFPLQSKKRFQKETLF